MSGGKTLAVLRAAVASEAHNVFVFARDTASAGRLLRQVSEMMHDGWLNVTAREVVRPDGRSVTVCVSPVSPRRLMGYSRPPELYVAPDVTGPLFTENHPRDGYTFGHVVYPAEGEG